MKYKLLCLFVLLSFSLSDLYADIELSSKQMRTSDGLPSNSVRCMFQDSKGFLWLGTLDGLTRYDGNTFLTYQLESGKHDRISLADNRIKHVAEDKNGFLWIKTVPELFSCYDLQKACFVDFTGTGSDGENYSEIFMSSNGDVWLWHRRNGVRQIVCEDDRTMTSVKFRTKFGNLPDDRIKFINEDSSGRIWIGTMRGLASVYKGKVEFIDRKLNFSSSFPHGEDMYFLTKSGDVYRCVNGSKKIDCLASLSAIAGNTSVSTHSLIKDKWVIFTSSEGVYEFDFQNFQITPCRELKINNGKVIHDNYGDCWAYNNTGRIYYINSKSGEIKNFQLIPEEKMKYIDYERYHVVRDDRGIVWISTYGNGLFTYDIQEDRLEHFVSEGKNAGPIGSDFLLCLMKDRTGGIWVSSEYSGLSHISISNKGITHVYPESPDVFDRSNTIRLLTKMSNGDIWVGTRRGGLYNYDSHLKTKIDNHYLPYNIYAISEDSQENVWIGTRGDGLKIGDTWYKTDPSNPFALSHSNIYSILRDKKDRMWVGTFGGGLDLAESTEKGQYKFRRFFQGKKYGLRIVRVMAEDEKGMIWMGTSEGICIFHPDSLIANEDNYHLFSYTDGNFCSNEIRCLFRDSKGRMWVGTSGAGLNLCELSDDCQSLKYTHYGIAEGLVNNMVQSILEDHSGQLWIATEYGISRFNPNSHSFENYFFSSYTLGNVYSENSACMGADGKLIFGTNYGLTIIDPKKIPTERLLSPIVITGLSVNGIQVKPNMPGSPLQESLAYSDKITLKYFQNSFMLDFSTLDYSDNGQIKYMYWLENYDKGWNVPSSLSFATYKYLEPGSYIFHVKYCDGAGIWNDTETTLKIVIVPPFWKTNWAMLGYFILMLIALYFTYRIIFNFNRLRNRINVEKQLTEYKLVFFTNISHEFRTPLTLIQGALEKMYRTDDIPQALLHPLKVMDKSTQRMLRLINQLLEFRKMQNNKLALSLQETDVVAFLYEIYLNFSDVAEQKNMDFRFLPSVPSYKMFIDKGNLDKVVYNLLSNAFKYTPSGGTILFSVNVDEAKKCLYIQVADTGVGIPKEKQGELFKRFMQSSFSGDSIGVGLHLSHELVQVHKGTIEYKDNEGGGSVFTVCIPTDKTVYSEKDFLVPGNLLLEEANMQTHHLQELSEECQEHEKTVTTSRKHKILVIEDDNDIRGFLQEELSAYFEVEVAADGISGFEKACNYDADLIICDVLMPGMTGFEVTKKLKTEFATSHIPIILLTALTSPDKHLEGLEAGADVYVAKPFSFKLLLAQVFRLIEQCEKLRKKFSSEPGVVRPALCNTDRDKEFADQLVAVVEKIYSQYNISIVCRQLPLFSGVSVTPDISRVTDNSKVTDHHAILPTVQLEKQDVSALPQSEQKILNLVGMRLLCATGEKHTYAETQITLSCEGYEFKTKGKTVVQNGWKAIEELFKSSLKTKEKDDPMKSLPGVHEGDVLDSVSASVTEHFTTPPKQYTEDTLLSAMETAGNDQFDDDTVKKGLGTPATRAGIIEKLVKSGFAERKGKSLIPTKDGCNLVCVLPEQITSPAMTAEWENTLMEIERGKADADAFLSGIVWMTGDLVKAYPFLSDAEVQRFGTGKEEIGKCPRCGSPVYVGKGNFYCSNKECSFCLWEDNKFFSSKKKKLTKKIAKELLDKGWCRVTGLYTPKKPQLYDAVIRLDDSGGKYVSFKMEFDR